MYFFRRKHIIPAVLIALLLAAYFFSLPRRLFREPLSTVILAEGGELLGARIAADGQWRFPQADSVPRKFAQCIVAFEDKRFAYHPGIDPLSIVRAAKDNFARRRVVSGASTITMQVIRLSRKKSSRGAVEKITEAILATRLELTRSKDEILALYASNAPFGGNVVGIEAAAWRYFGRTAHDLSWAEAATLAVLPNSPSLIHFGRNRQKLKAKRDNLLQKLCRRKMIDAQTLELAMDEPVPDKPLPLPMYAPHLLDRAVRERPQQITRTNIDFRLQRMASDAANSYSKSYRGNKVSNIAVFAAETKTGKVVAYVGNACDPADSVPGASVDIITARRSSGSTLKPILYAAMLDRGDILPSTLVPDIPMRNKSFAPNNFNRTFDGAVPANRVLERSLNVPTVNMLQDYGLENFHLLLRRFGFSTITRPAEHYGLTLILGGAEITLWDLCNAYSLMAQKLAGQRTFRKTSLYADTQVVPRSIIPIGAGALWTTFSSLENVNRPEEEQGWQKFEFSRRIAWKTGTSYGNRDAWSVGITPDYVVGVWVGNASGEGRPQLTGVGYAAPVMFDILSLLPRTGWFEKPEIDMRREAVCAKSGYKASTLCPKADTVWIPAKGIDTPLCPYHIEVTLSRDGRYRVNSDCEEVSQMRREVWFVLPPAQEWYYRQCNPDYRTLPPLHPDFSQSSSAARLMEIIYPSAGMVVVPARRIDGSGEGVIFHAVHSDPSAQIYWHVDGEYLGITTGEHKIKWSSFAAGNHRLTLVDSRGNTINLRFGLEAVPYKN